MIMLISFDLGLRNCTLPQCYEPGQCLGSLIQGSLALSANECIERCKADSKCNYFNYNEDKYCALLKDCAFVDNSCNNLNGCIFGQVECERQQEYAMIVMGWDSILVDAVEVIDLDTFLSCPIQQLPYPTEGSTAAALRNGDNVLICGGWNQSVIFRECYEYKDGAWDQTVSMITPRVGPSPVEIRPKEWLLIGKTH